MTTDADELREKSDRLATQERKTYARLCAIRDELDETTALIGTLTSGPHLFGGAGSIGGLLGAPRRRRWAQELPMNATIASHCQPKPRTCNSGWWRNASAARKWNAQVGAVQKGTTSLRSVAPARRIVSPKSRPNRSSAPPR